MGEERIEEQVDLQKLLDAEKQRSEEYLTRLKYLQADFENFKKRFDRQMEETKNYCTETLVVQLLDIVDELELAVKTAKTQASPEPLIEGVKLTLKKLKKVLEQQGVSPIAVRGGQSF